MLCAGGIHGDLSEFHVLLAADGPVISTCRRQQPCAAHADAGRNLRRYFGQYAPALLATGCYEHKTG